MSNPVIHATIFAGASSSSAAARQRSFAGPIVLIILGIVFLLGTMRVLSVGKLAHLFASYWPVLLILWGVIKLIEHLQAQRHHTRPRASAPEESFLSS